MIQGMSESEATSVFYSYNHDSMARAQVPAILDSHALNALGISELGPVLEYRQQLVCTSRAISLRLRSLEYFAELTSPYEDASNTTFTKFMHLFEPEPFHPVQREISLPPDDTVGCMQATTLSTEVAECQHAYCRIRDAYDYIRSLARRTQTALYEQLSEVSRKLRRVNDVVAIIGDGHPQIPRFCSVRWERRRWFLHHGARPPKQTVQAILGLFTGACSGSPIAY